MLENEHTVCSWVLPARICRASAQLVKAADWHGLQCHERCWKNQLHGGNRLWFHVYSLVRNEPGWRSRYSHWLRPGRPRGRSWSPSKVKNFLFPMSSRPALGSTQPPIQWIKGSLSPGLKGPGREADHSPPASAEVKKIWIYISNPPYAFMA
jgi:hypothetical protein